MSTEIQEFQMAEWEVFTTRGQLPDGEVVSASVDRIWTETHEDGSCRIYAVHPDGPLWLRPQDVPPRVLRGDSAWPRTHPLEYRRIIRAGQASIDLDEDEKVAARLAALPEPEVRARPATLEEIPRGARTIGVKATQAGFELAVTYARGPRVDQYWRVSEISDTIMIRGKHADGRRFGAMWITKTAKAGTKAGQTSWALETAYLIDQQTRYWTACNATELSAYLVTS